MAKIEVRLDGALGHCSECGAQATKIAAVTGIPSHIPTCGTGRLNIPFCDRCFIGFGNKKVSR